MYFIVEIIAIDKYLLIWNDVIYKGRYDSVTLVLFNKKNVNKENSVKELKLGIPVSESPSRRCFRPDKK